MQMISFSRGYLSFNETDIYYFIKARNSWYINLGNSLELAFNRHGLELKEGAHQILNLLSNGANKLRIRLSLERFEGANLLQLVEHCPAPKGGGVYLFNPQKENNSFLFWICDLALYVFGDVPEQFFIKRLPFNTKYNMATQKAAPFKLMQNQSVVQYKKAA